MKTGYNYRLKMHQYLQMELTSKSKYYYDKDNGIHVTYFEQLDRAYVECDGDSYWFEASGIFHALDQYHWINKKELAV